MSCTCSTLITCFSLAHVCLMGISSPGEVGDWKNHFSPAQSQEMDTAFEKHLAGTKLGAKLKYDLYCK